MILGAKGKEQLSHMNHKKKMFNALWFMIKCRVSKKKMGEESKCIDSITVGSSETVRGRDVSARDNV